MTITLESVIQSEIRDRLDDAKLGLIVKGIIELDPLSIPQISEGAASELDSDLFVACVGYDIGQVLKFL